MAEGTEVEERVDLEEDNYMEGMDDDVDEPIDEDGADEGGKNNAEENTEADHHELTSKVEEDEKSTVEGGHEAEEPSDDDKELPTAPVDDEVKEKHAQLLAQPPHGSEVFIGGLPRDTSEEDLKDLCEPMGEIHEVIIYNCCMLLLLHLEVLMMSIQ